MPFIYKLNRPRRRLLFRFLGAGILGLVVSSVTLVRPDAIFPWRVLLYGFALGYFTAWAELRIIRRLETTKYWFNVGLRVVVHSIIYLAINALSVLVFNWLGWVDPNIDKYERTRLLITSFTIIVSIVAFLRVEAIIGVGFVHKFVLGVYRHPKREFRYFMFIDLNHSTRISEKLGDEKYFAFLNKFFRDLSPAIFQAGGIIYKYVGDEIIVSWNRSEKHSVPDIALELYKEFKRTLKRNSVQYKKEFGIVPSFKAGFHGGMVVTAQVGDLKKEIAYNGNVVNIAARLVGRCKDFGMGLLVSERVYEELENPPKKALEICELLLDGSKYSINVFGIK